MQNSSPSNLEQWQSFFSEKKFPVGARNLSMLRRLFNDEESRFEHIQNIIEKEPMLGLAVLIEATQSSTNKENDIKSPIHAASMIGMNKIIKLPNRLEPFVNNSKASAMYLRGLQTSYEAAYIAKQWASIKFPNQEEDIFWITFFRGAVRWMLYFYAEPTISACENAIRKGAKPEQAEQERFGCRLDELTPHLLNLWGAPNAIIQSFLAQNLPNTKEMTALAELTPHPDLQPKFTEDKTLALLINKPLFLSHCAHRVAYEVRLKDWDSKELTFYYRVIASALHVPFSKVISLTHLAAARAANFSKLSHRPLACKLLNPNLFYRGGRSKPRTLKGLDRLKSALLPHKGDNTQQAKIALKAIKKRIINTHRVLIISIKNQHCRPIAQFGHNVSTIKSNNWNAPSSTLQRLSQKRSATHLQGSKLNKVGAGLPDQAPIMLNGCKQAIFASAPVSNNEVLVFWLDTEQDFSDNDYKDLKQIITTLSDAL
ncbi:HDOD domain-containing protein [Marinomonas epiphytica]